jgi:HlyD family secretion protein
MKFWQMIRGWLIGIVVIAAGIAGLQYYVMRPEPVDVRITRVAKGLVEETVSSTKAGSVRSRQIADISVEVPGTVTAIHAREGKAVKKNDPLITLDSRDAEAALAVSKKELASAESMLAETKARWEDAVREHRRLLELKKTESIAQAQVDQAETTVKVTAAAHGAAESRVELQKSVLARAQLAVDKCVLVAPFDGVISQLLVEVGEWVNPGRAALKLLDPDRLYIRAEIDEVDIGSIKEDLDARISLDPYKGHKFFGKIRRVSPYVTEVQEQNRTVVIEIELTEGLNGFTLKHGTSADVEVILRKAPDVLRVPTLSLLDGNRVLVVGSDNVAKAVSVKIGLKNWEFAQVVEGLSGGEPVIVSLESEQVKEGVPVKITKESER